MSKPIFAVFGATGNQGNSAANFVLSDPELSQRYTVRAVSRDTSNPKMQALASKGAELAQADLDDPSSLPAALTSVTHLFFLTTTQYQGHSREIETRQAKSLCTAALAGGVQYIIFSSMSHPLKISSGALQHVEHFDAKAEIEQYIRSLPVQSSFFAPASFMQNFAAHSAPKPVGDGSYAISNILHPHTRVPLIDIADTGKWVGAILADPRKYSGAFLAAAEGLYTLPQACELMSKVSGKTVRYVQVEDEVYKGFLTPVMRLPYYEMWVLNREYGYYGEGQEEMVEWAKGQARCEVTGLEEWLVREKFSVE